MLNQCNFIGNLGRDPETRFTQGGDPVCNFSIGCGEKYKDKQGNQQEKTEWVSVVVWGKLAEICQEYLAKGSRVFISGKMQTRKWQDQSGADRYTTEIVARDMKMLSPRSESGGGQHQDNGYGGEPPQHDMGSDVPF